MSLAIIQAFRCGRIIVLCVKISMSVLRLKKCTNIKALLAINKICVRGSACNSACARSSADMLVSVVCMQTRLLNCMLLLLKIFALRRAQAVERRGAFNSRKSIRNVSSIMHELSFAKLRRLSIIKLQLNLSTSESRCEDKYLQETFKHVKARRSVYNQE